MRNIGANRNKIEIYIFKIKNIKVNNKIEIYILKYKNVHSYRKTWK
jgi:hypothetical protein